jgi:GxxExxY protein
MLELEDATTIDYTGRPYDALTRKIIGAAIEVHKALGPGLLESSYQACLIYELKQIGLKVEWEKGLPVKYKEVKLDCGYRLDILVEESVIVEVKSVVDFAKIHEAQLITYLKMSGCRVGLLINFNVRFLKEGIRRIIV